VISVGQRDGCRMAVGAETILIGCHQARLKYGMEF
jgi:hypothetical protein